MSKLISSVLFSYLNDKGREVKYVNPGSENDPYPFKLFSQECIRVSRFLGRYGVESASVLQAFIDGMPVPASDTVAYSEYKGNQLIELHAQAGDKNGLRFGAGKAKKLVALFKAHSLGDLQATLEAVIGDAKPADSRPPRKGGKGKGQGGGGGKPQAQDEAPEVEVLAHQARGVEELSLAQQIAQMEGVIRQIFEALPAAQGKLRALYAARDNQAVSVG